MAVAYATDLFSKIYPPAELADAHSSKPPIDTVTLRERDQMIQGEMWVYPGRISSETEALKAISEDAVTLNERHSRMYNHGFVDANFTLVKLLVEGRRNKPVRVVGMRANVVSRKPVKKGYSILGPGPQGISQNVNAGLNLDEADPTARIISDEANPYSTEYFGKPLFATYNSALGRGEQEVYAVTARTFSHDIEWYIELTIVSADADEPMTVQVGNRGRPFRTTGVVPNRELERELGVVMPTYPDFRAYSEVYRYKLDGFRFETAREF